MGVDWKVKNTLDSKIAKSVDIAFTGDMNEKLSDEQLILKYSKGDLSAFEILYSRHKAPLFRYCFRQFSNPAIAEECFQEIWMKLINGRVNYKPKALFTTYLYRIAQNHVIDTYRKEKKRKGEIEFEEQNVKSEQIENLDLNRTNNEQVASLRKAITELPFEQKNALLLKLDAGLSIEEISHILDCGKETVKSRLRYATKKLKGLLNANSGELEND